VASCRDPLPLRILRSAAFLACFASPAAPAEITDPQDIQGSLKKARLEELMDIEVTSVSKRPERRLEAAAAIYVITAEDILRSGATSIPEALRMAPGVQVARIDANKWAIGVRGFTSRLSRSLLVLIDGRAVYSPLFAGVYWEVQDTLLEDVERIEVIRGPGGTLWGANAVNGVVNIITKRARDTQGGFLSGGGGSEQRGLIGLRYGGERGPRLHYRVYGKFFDQDAAFHESTSDFDAWRMGRVGFRADWERDESNSLSVQGDYYGGKSGQRTRISSYAAPFSETVEEDADLAGGNLLGRWRRVRGDASVMILQTYYDRTDRREPSFREARDTVDVDFQHSARVTGRQQLTWGIGYRVTRDDSSAVPTIEFNPSSRSDHLPSAFIQDEISSREGRFRFTIGSKLEHNDYSGFEAQPNVRLSWDCSEQCALWGAITRAVRTPSRLEHDLLLTALLDPAGPIFTRVIGSRDFDSEEIVSYESGLRIQPAPRVSVDLVAFLNRYDNLLSLESGTPFLETSPQPDHTVVPVLLENGIRGRTYGAEIAVDWAPSGRLRLGASYSRLQIELERKPESNDASTAESTEGSSPRHRVVLRSSLDLPRRVAVDLLFRYVGALPSQSIDSYENLDAVIRWLPVPNLEFSVVGQNLLDARHAEFGGGSGGVTQVERGVYGKLAWRW
jgi:iron complex outermembrane receptor protein